MNKAQKSSLVLYDSAQKSIEIIDTIHSIAIDSSYRNLTAYTKMLKGNYYSYQGDYKNSLKQYLQGYQIAKQLNDSNLIAKIAVNIGDAHLNVGNYETAYSFFNIAQNIVSKTGDTLSLAIALFNEAVVMKNLKKYEDAEQQLRLSLSLSEKIDDDEGPAFVYNELGDIKYMMRQYDSAMFYLSKAYKEASSLSIQEIKIDNLIKMGCLYNEIDEIDEALIHFNEAKEMIGSFPNAKDEMRANNGLTQSYINLSQWDQALELTEENLGLAKKVESLKELLETYELRSKILESMGNFRSALEAHKLFSTIEDSLRKSNFAERIDNLEVQYELEKRDFEISLLSNREQQKINEIERQQNLQNILVVLLALMFFLLLSVYRAGVRRRKINDLLRTHREEVIKQKNELNELNKVKDKFISILAHDLRSPIRSLTGLLGLLEMDGLSEEESKKIVSDIKTKMQQTSTLLNNLLEWTMVQMDSISIKKTGFNIKELVDENLKLVENPHQKDMKLINEVQENTVYADRNMIDLALRNILSNSMKFTEEGSIIVKSELEQDKVSIIIRDTGIGMSGEEQQMIFAGDRLWSKMGTSNEKGTGLGLKLTKEFIEKNGGEISVKSTLGEGTEFKFTIPLMM